MSGIAAERITVLIVDDEPDVRLVARLVLSSAGYRVEEAAGGEEALALLATVTGPAVVLLDIRMPGVDGWQVLNRARSDPDTSGVPVVVFTADATAADEAASKLEPRDRLLVKPFKPDQLVDAIQAAVAAA